MGGPREFDSSFVFGRVEIDPGVWREFSYPLRIFFVRKGSVIADCLLETILDIGDAVLQRMSFVDEVTLTNRIADEVSNAVEVRRDAGSSAVVVVLIEFSRAFDVPVLPETSDAGLPSRKHSKA